MAMKKIKSSLEIALEKIGEVQENREELEKLNHEKYLKAASSLGNSFLENKINKEQLAESIHRYPESIREKALRIFIARLVEGINPSNTMGILEAITFLTDDAHIKKTCQKTAGLFQQYLEGVAKKKATLQEKLRHILEDKLAQEGFRGSALAGFNITGTEQWQKTAALLEAEYNTILKDFKETILQQPGSRESE